MRMQTDDAGNLALVGGLDLKDSSVALECPPDGYFKRRQIVSHSSPDGIHVDMVILVAKPVADPTYVAPRKAWAESLSLIAEPDRGFADHLQLAFDGCHCFRVSAESFRVHAQRKLPDRSNGVGDVAQRK